MFQSPKAALMYRLREKNRKTGASVDAVLGKRAIRLGDALLLAGLVELLGNAIGQLEQTAVRATTHHKAAYYI